MYKFIKYADTAAKINKNPRVRKAMGNDPGYIYCMIWFNVIVDAIIILSCLNA